MIDVGSLLQSPPEAQSASTVASQAWMNEEKGPQFLELRTETGSVYVCPSRWQRIRLQWAFRHFRVLPRQVLSRSAQRLIVKLALSAVVTPALPVPGNRIFGVVEKPPSKLAQASHKPEVATLPGRPELRFRHWRVLAALAAAWITVALASVYRIPLFSSNPQTSNTRTVIAPANRAPHNSKPPAIHTASTSPFPAAAASASLLNPDKPRRWIAPPPTQPAPADQNPLPPASGSAESFSGGSVSGSPVSNAAMVVPGVTPAPAAMVPSQRPLVSELPQGHFAHPVVPETNLAGEVRLKALIGADGSVKEVIVISGDPKLAASGMQAVRQWHYSPYQLLGNPVEVETQIRMTFFGQDAISISSVAAGSPLK
jgi:protein TonB